MIIERPARPSVCKVNCQRCHDCGELACFQEEYGTGWFWAFCDCEIGKQVEYQRYLDAGYPLGYLNCESIEEVKPIIVEDNHHDSEGTRM